MSDEDKRTDDDSALVFEPKTYYEDETVQAMIRALMPKIPLWMRLEGIPNEVLMERLTPEQLAAGLSPEQLILGLPDDWLRKMTDKVIQTLSLEAQAKIRRWLGRDE